MIGAVINDFDVGSTNYQQTYILFETILKENKLQRRNKIKLSKFLIC